MGGSNDGFKQKGPGYKKTIAEGVSGDEFFRKESKWVKKERLIKRQANHYRETVTDPVTGEVICRTVIDNHRETSGSAKAKRLTYRAA